MAKADDDTPILPTTVYDTPKGGAYGGPITPAAGLDPNVKALLMDYRWTTTFNGNVPATALKYSFPKQESDYTVVPGYPDEDIAGFIEATPFQAEAPQMQAPATVVRDGNDRTFVFLQMLFEPTDENQELAKFIRAANEQNFDRLAQVLANGDP